MIKTTMAAFGVLALLSSAAFAAPPNDVGEAGRGGSAYYNPSPDNANMQPQSGNQRVEVGTTGEGGGVYTVPGYAQRG
jgi:hypothetical protein